MCNYDIDVLYVRLENAEKKIAELTNTLNEVIRINNLFTKEYPITASMVTKLMEKTGECFYACKKALIKNHGDMEKASAELICYTREDI